MPLLSAEPPNGRLAKRSPPRDGPARAQAPHPPADPRGNRLADAATARITMRDLPGDVYESDLHAENTDTDPFRREIARRCGIMLAVTHVVDPAVSELARANLPPFSVLSRAGRRASSVVLGNRSIPGQSRRVVRGVFYVGRGRDSRSWWERTAAGDASGRGTAPDLRGAPAAGLGLGSPARCGRAARAPVSRR